MFEIDQDYSKADIYKLLRVPSERQKGAWDTGYREYEGNIYIFANIGIPGRTGHDYDNYWEGSNLIWYGKTSSHINQPMIQQMIEGEARVYIFTRSDDRKPFTFKGEAYANSYDDISPIKITWTFKKSNLINVKEAWQIFIKNAKIRHNSQETFVSPIHHHKYKIVGVDDKEVSIMRMSVDSKTEENINYSTFEAAIYKLNNSGGVLARKDLYGNVSIETTLVQLLPMLDWDNDSKRVMVYLQDSPAAFSASHSKIFKEAKNDTEMKMITRMLRMRRGQNKLRENLFYLYNSKCCITQYSIKEVLHACHIIPHSKSGLNTTTNALLLRADIHDLFDSNLLAINPKSLKVKTSKVLQNTEYLQMDGIEICKRIDGITPDIEALKYKWEFFSSLNSTG